MLRGGISLVNQSQIKNAADAYEFAGNKQDMGGPSDQKNKGGDSGGGGGGGGGAKAGSKDWLPLNLLKSPQSKTKPDHTAAVTITSPGSHGSSFTNSGLFDNLTEHDHDAARTDVDHSLALSDSAGYIDNDSKL